MTARIQTLADGGIIGTCKNVLKYTIVFEFCTYIHFSARSVDKDTLSHRNNGATSESTNLLDGIWKIEFLKY